MAQSNFGDDIMDVVLVGGLLLGGYLLFKKMTGSSAVSLPGGGSVNPATSGITNEISSLFGSGAGNIASDILGSGSTGAAASGAFATGPITPTLENVPVDTDIPMPDVDIEVDDSGD